MTFQNISITAEETSPTFFFCHDGDI